jgi:dihydrofolate synthase/folylpolyglutamate synthase
VDGAHNEDAAKRLKESLKAYFPNETFTFVMGMFRDKEYEKVLEQLLPLANELYTVTTSGERGLSDTELALCAGNKTRIPVYSGQTIENVLTELFETAGDKKTVVCGSLSILKDVYRFAIKADISTFDRQD